jgi:hypothetical protein
VAFPKHLSLQGDVKMLMNALNSRAMLVPSKRIASIPLALSIVFVSRDSPWPPTIEAVMVKTKEIRIELLEIDFEEFNWEIYNLPKRKTKVHPSPFYLISIDIR